jgi:hypothetical protein
MADTTDFDATTGALRSAIDKLLDQAEELLPLVAAAKNSMSDCDFAVAKLRRQEDAIGQGPLNSVSAVQQSHKGLAKALETLSQDVLHLFDIRRELSTLHSSVSAAVADGIARQAALKEDANPAAP